jgi:hypothetical protein
MLDGLARLLSAQSLAKSKGFLFESGKIIGPLNRFGVYLYCWMFG